MKGISSFRAGRFKLSVASDITAVHTGIQAMYPEVSPNVDHNAEFFVELNSRRYIKRQVIFSRNGKQPFTPLPLAQAYPLLEWGVNWCVSQNYHQALIFHAAVLTKNNTTILFPGLPGAGKSTLSAAMTFLNGWQLLSDELAMIDLNTAQVMSNPRPISLKNRSIDILKNALPNGIFSSSVTDTAKGTVAHLRAPCSSIERWAEMYTPTHIIFPHFSPKRTANLTHVSTGETAIKLIENSFNYHVLGKLGFRALTRLLSNVSCFDMHYDGDFESAFMLLGSEVLA